MRPVTAPSIHARPIALLAICLSIAVLVAPRIASAEDGGIFTNGWDLMTGYHVSAGYFYETGPSDLRPYGRDEFQGNPLSTGIRYYERQGIISGYLIGIVTALAGAYSNTLPVRTETTRHGNWIETKTYYKSAAQRARDNQRTADRSARIAGATNQSFQFETYMRSLPGPQGNSSGYRLNMFFGKTFSNKYMLDFGFGFGRVDSLWKENGIEYRSEWLYAGMPFRFNIPFSVALLYVQWDWNWLGHGDPYYEYKDKPQDPTRIFAESTPFPLRAGVTLALLKRIHAEIQVITPSALSFEFAYRINLGVNL